MTDNVANQTIINGAAYGAANQLLTLFAEAQKNVSGNGNSTTLAQYGGGSATAFSLTGSQGAFQPAGVLTPNQPTLGNPGQVLAHEFLQVYTGMSDPQIIDAFAQYGLGAGSTSNITNLISTNCNYTPPQ